MSRKVIGLWALVLFLGLLGLGTINNQLRINKANATLAEQAMNGQRALTRTCRLVPVTRKIYGDMLDRKKITVDDYELVIASAAAICPPRP